MAGELAREGFTQPLLIGGATTSRAHTAVRIAPAYPSPVGARARRLARRRGGQQSPERRAPAGVRGGGARRAGTAPEGARRQGRGGPLRPLAEARRRAVQLEWPAPPPKPSFLGVREFRAYPLEELVPRIDWTPFFQAWELKGIYPAILDDPTTGAAARELLARRPRRCSTRSSGTAASRRARCWGSFPPPARGATTSRSSPTRAAGSPRGSPHHPPADDEGGRPRPTSRWPTSWRRRRRVPDYLGRFAVTAGHGLDALVAAFEAAHDDYGAILAKALADRLAEAFAERLHERVRREFWGYAPERVARQRGADPRAVPGHPAGAGLPRLPRSHREADHLRAARGRADGPASSSPRAARCSRPPSVSGLYFWHPRRRTSASAGSGATRWRTTPAGRAGAWQEAERWLAPNLGYERA